MNQGSHLESFINGKNGGSYPLWTPELLQHNGGIFACLSASKLCKLGQPEAKKRKHIYT